MIEQKILIVINPNPLESVTSDIDSFVQSLRGFGVLIHRIGLAEGLLGIESQKQADLTITSILSLTTQQTDAAVYVIAFGGYPRLHALRDHSLLLVVGIQEAVVTCALNLDQSFGVIVILSDFISHQLRAFRAIEVLYRSAGSRALGLGVTDHANHDRS